MPEAKTIIQTELLETAAPPYPPPLPFQLQQYAKTHDGSKPSGFSVEWRKELLKLKASTDKLRLPKSQPGQFMAQVSSMSSKLASNIAPLAANFRNYLSDASNIPYKACVVVGCGVLAAGLTLAPFTSSVLLLIAFSAAAVQFILAALLKPKSR